MKATHKAFLSIATALVVLIIVFRIAGGCFNRQFWLAFLPGLMGNLVILAVAIFVIENIFRKERLLKLGGTNAAQSRFVLFISNRLAFVLLEYLALATKDEFRDDATLNFEFACERMRGVNLAAVFYEKLMGASDREAFVSGFETLLNEATDGIFKSLEKIYPRPDPAIIQVIERMLLSAGGLSALKMFLRSFEILKEEGTADQQFNPEQVDLLIKVGFGHTRLALQNLQRDIVDVSDRARTNKLFVSFE